MNIGAFFEWINQYIVLLWTSDTPRKLRCISNSRWLRVRFGAAFCPCFFELPLLITVPPLLYIQQSPCNSPKCTALHRILGILSCSFHFWLGTCLVVHKRIKYRFSTSGYKITSIFPSHWNIASAHTNIPSLLSMFSTLFYGRGQAVPWIY
jgi:hypothetical protein